MRLTESCLKGRVVEEGIRARGGVVGWVITLFFWHTAQPVINLETKTERPGHQKSHSTTALGFRQKNVSGLEVFLNQSLAGLFFFGV